MLSSTTLSFFSSMLTNDSMYRGVDDHFLEHPCARGQKRGKALNKFNCSLCLKVPFFFQSGHSSSRQSIK